MLTILDPGAANATSGPLELKEHGVSVASTHATAMTPGRRAGKATQLLQPELPP